ncbi:MAG: 4Fe-4S dicluster domain-containing protein [Acidobacteriota bacterium]
MTDSSVHARERLRLEPPALQGLIEILRSTGYQVYGPVVGNGGLVYGELASVDDLPVGQTDIQGPGSYRFGPRDDDAWFGYAVGQQSWKRFLYEPATELWRAERKGHGVKLVPTRPDPAPMAFIGVRACELAALAILDRVMLQGPYVAPIYQGRRGCMFLVAVQCGSPGDTCFCASMGTGPRVTSGADVTLTEVAEPGEHWFLAEAGSDQGAAALAGLVSRRATEAERARADAVVARAASAMGRQVKVEGLAACLAARYEHPRWTHVASRCLGCANCTMVCPTCFCSTVEDTTDLSGAEASRWRRWDSCFTLEFSYIHGGSVRSSVLARYRQWLTHKFSTWVEQFGTFGCVGCGRCITWCPVGIDVTEEVRLLSEGYGTMSDAETA